MNAPVERYIDQLIGMPLTELRSEWHRWHPDRCMPERLPRDLLVRTIAWKVQEKEFGRAPSTLATRLDRLSSQLSRSGVLDVEREARLKAGTTIVREWRGETHRVTALEDGFQWDGRRFQSLSEIARTITGVRWSGPRFFGLNHRSRSTANPAAEQPHD